MNDISLFEKEKNGFLISTDKSKLNIHLIHHFLSAESYWAKNIPFGTVQKSIEGSVCFAVYNKTDFTQVGFARVITDGASFGYLADVFVLHLYRGKGLSKWMLEEILAHHDLQQFRRWLLATKDAHSLYTKFGFKLLENPERYMRLSIMDVYPEKPENE